MQLDQKTFQSRFAARIFGVFILCAILPITAFSIYAYSHVRAQLEDDAALALQQAAKSAGMSIVEHLLIAQAQLELHTAASPRVGSRRTSAFSSLQSLPSSQLELDDRSRAHLERGETLMLHRLDGLALARADGSDVVVGELDPIFLFTPGRIGSGERYWVTGERGRLLFTADQDDRTAELVAPHLQQASRERFRLEGQPEIAFVWPLFIRNPFGSDGLRIGFARSEASILRPLRSFRRIFPFAVMFALVGATAIALHQVRLRVRPLEHLTQVTSRIAAGDMKARARIRSGDEFEDLSESFNHMAEEIDRNVSTLEGLTEVGSHLIESTDLLQIARLTAEASLSLTNAESAVFFHVQTGRQGALEQMTPMAAHTRQGVRPIVQDPTAAELARRAVECRMPVVVARSGESSLDPELWASLDPSANQSLDRISSIPITSEQGVVEGVLQLGESLAHEPERPSVLDASGLSILLGQAGAAIRNVELIESLRGLFEGVIELTVQAIDEKSPYTGDHCRRVPILTELIADAACETDTGVLKDFALSEAQRYELRIASLLHDCGKVATPVHVMDKATKLEKILDRIDLVEVRAEILRRDIEITALRQQSKGPDDKASSSDLRVRQHEMLDEDLAFIREYNVGREFMPPELQQRVEEIQRRYEWIDSRGESRSLLTDDEAANLQVSQGTLNREEREVIDRHIVTTIKLLEQLPFPPELQSVPAIAGGHHEHVDGTGFPKQLGEEELDMSARILGLADVFEALTARDRPYKRGKTLNQTLEILRTMVDARHIDSDLFAALLEKNVHLRYAADHMEPNQIDEVYQAGIEALTAPWNAQASDRRST